MLPKMPARSGQLGFVYVPPYRVQGTSVAGESTAIQVPELDVCFDMGSCPRTVLSSPFVALSHGHMDHVGGLPYYFSQRHFQKMGTGTVVCHPDTARPLEAMMRSWVDLERQRTPHRIVPLAPDAELEIKNNIMLRAIEVGHTVPALGFAIIERRSKLREEFRDLPQERLRELKREGVEITRTLEIPLVAYTGDTELGPFLFRDEFAKAKVVIAECTFVEPDHRSRATVGKHLHAEDIGTLLNAWEAEHVVLCHLSRRENIADVRKIIRRVVGDVQSERVLMLMDHRANRARYERQLAECAAPTSAAPSMSEDLEED